MQQLDGDLARVYLGPTRLIRVKDHPAKIRSQIGMGMAMLAEWRAAWVFFWTLVDYDRFSCAGRPHSDGVSGNAVPIEIPTTRCGSDVIQIHARSQLSTGVSAAQ